MRFSLLAISLILVACGQSGDYTSDRRGEFGSAKSNDAGAAKKPNSPKDNSPAGSSDSSSKPESPAPIFTFQDGLNSINRDLILEDITLFAGDGFEGRGTGEKGNKMAADWLVQQLQAAEIEPFGVNGYFQNFSAQGRTTQNIIGVIRPQIDSQYKNEYVVIGAHMDHLGKIDCSGTGGDLICNGADDNASGSIGVLHVARTIKKLQSDLKRTVIVMWFSGEEMGLLGSYYFVKNPVVSLSSIAYMINMDMISYYKSNGAVDMLGGAGSSIAESILKKINTRYSDVNFNITKQAGGGSDHVPFMERGIPGVFFHTGVSNNPHYHKPSDTVLQPGFDVNGMTMVAKIAFEHLYEISRFEGSLRSVNVAFKDFQSPNPKYESLADDLRFNPFSWQNQ